MSHPTDQNLLLGILALQMDFVTRDQLVAAMHAWVLDKSRPLDAVLFQQGALREDTRALLSALVAKHLELHAGDAQQSLAAVSSLGPLREELRSLGDRQIEDSLAVIPAAGDPYATLPTSAGGASADSLRFRVLRPHAQGGIGQVSVALDNELHREVALKEIQTRFADDAHSRARFVLEAEITGGLEHPGIVPVYGLGQYADGRPFYAMRFIRGDSLQDAADRFHRAGPVDYASLEFRQLLGRFTDVCNAIEYAHSRGVLHRDLKPGNIMLGKYGETLVVDWGLAKAQGRSDAPPHGGEAALAPVSASGTAPTLLGATIGTPAYMSPEQAAGRLGELGAASDVYSLGATLYYVLTGRPPVASASLATVLGSVQAGDFPRPSAVSPQIPKPLEAICLRAMALSPAQRYASPAALADDIERWLADEPVTAYPEPWKKRARRWLRKHPRSIAALTAAVVVGVASLAVTAAIVSGKNRQLAAANQSLRVAHAAEHEARGLAERRLAQAERGAELLGDVFAELDPEAEQKEGRPLRAILGERLAAAAEQLDGQVVGDELTVARLQQILGNSQQGLGFYQEAVALHAKAHETRRRLLGENHVQSLGSLNDLAVACHQAGDIDRALRLLEDAVGRMKLHLGSEHELTVAAMNNLASACQSDGRFERASHLYHDVLAIRRTKLPPGDSRTLGTLNGLAVLYQSQGDLQGALPLFEEVLEDTRQTLGPHHPHTIGALNNLANAYRAAQQPGKSLAICQEALAATREHYGPEDPLTLVATTNVADAYRLTGRPDEAVPLFEFVLAKREENLGPDHPDTLVAMSNLGAAYQAAGQVQEALPLLAEAFAGLKTKRGPDHSQTLTAMHNLAVAHEAAGEPDKALPLYEEALASLRAGPGKLSPIALSLMKNLAAAYLSQSRPDQAIVLLDEYLSARRDQLGADHPALATVLAEASATLLKHGQYAQAERLLREGQAILQSRQPDGWPLFDVRSMLGEALAGQRQFAAAEPLLLAGYEGMQSRQSEMPAAARPSIAEALERLVALYTAWDKPDEAARWKAKLDKAIQQP